MKYTAPDMAVNPFVQSLPAIVPLLLCSRVP